MSEFNSPNFSFLKDLDSALMQQAALAEHYCINDPSYSLVKLRFFGKFLSKNIAARSIVYIDPQSKQHEILKELRFKDVLDSKLADMFHSTQETFWLMSSELPRLRQGQRCLQGKDEIGFQESFKQKCFISNGATLEKPK